MVDFPSQGTVALESSARGPQLVSEADVVGTYYLGGGTGVNLGLVLNRDHTFQYHWSGCLGVYETAEGIWSVEGDKVLVQPVPDDLEGSSEGLSRVLVPMVFDGHVYLADEIQAPGFLSNITAQSGWVSQTVHRLGAYVKIDKAGNAVKVDLADRVPERFKPFVDQEVECRVKEMRGDGLVLIDAGSNAGLFPGVRLLAKDESPVELVIVSVTKVSSLARAEIVSDDPGSLEEGDLFSSLGMYGNPFGTGVPRRAFRW